MLGIILLMSISMIIAYIKVGLFSREYTEFDLIVGATASLIIVGFFILYGVDVSIGFSLSSIPVSDETNDFGLIIKESFFNSIKVLKIMYALGVISCFLIPLCKLIKNRYLNLSK